MEISPGFTGGTKRAEQKKKGRAQSKPKKVMKNKPPSIIGNGLATALPKKQGGNKNETRYKKKLCVIK